MGLEISRFKLYLRLSLKCSTLNVLLHLQSEGDQALPLGVVIKMKEDKVCNVVRQQDTWCSSSTHTFFVFSLPDAEQNISP